MKIAFLTDLHLRDDRLAAQAAALDALPNDVDLAEPDLILIGGDLAGVEVPHRATPGERNALVKLVRALADTAPVVMVRGNHDSLGDYDFLNVLESKHPITYVDEPELLQCDAAFVLCLPWLDRSAVARGADYGEAVRARYDAALKHALTAMAAAADMPRVLLCHGAVRGASIREGQPAVPTADPELDLARLAPEGAFDVALFGHYHAAQELRPATRTATGPLCPAYYGGSLFASDYGEGLDGHGWTLYDTEPTSGPLAKEVAVTRFPVAQVPRMVLEFNSRKLVDVRPAELAVDLAVDPHLPEFMVAGVAAKGAHVKLVCRLPEGDGPALAFVEGLRKRALDAGALSVRLELCVERTVRMRVGAERVAKAATLEAKIAATVDSVGVGLARGKPTVGEVADMLALLKDIEMRLDGGTP